MNAREIKDRVNEDILAIVGSFVELRKAGTSYKGCCPIHNEKTPSFVVTPSKGLYKCFGCGVGGDAVDFIMRHEGVDFKRAVEIGASKIGIQFNFARDNSEPYNEAEEKHKESLRIVCRMAMDFFELQLEKNATAMQYVAGRQFNNSADHSTNLGYAPKGYGWMSEWAKQNAIKVDALVEVGLMKINAETKQPYEAFRDRIIFPIADQTGKIVAFSGRALSPTDKAPKYINSPETLIYTKGNVLLGLNVARQSISKNDRAFVVEGNFDMLRLHRIGVENTVAPCGTALTSEQIQLLKKYTNKVVLLYDGDHAGRAATRKNAEALIREQFYVSVVALKDGEDPDTAFPDLGAFEEAMKLQQDYFSYRTDEVLASSEVLSSPGMKSEFVKHMCQLAISYPEPLQQSAFIEQISKKIKPAKMWTDELKRLQEVNSKSEKPAINRNINLEDYEKWGFFEENGCYMFPARKEGSFEKRSNFVMYPLFFLESTINAKRLYEIKNQFGVVRQVEIPQKDMVSIAAFKWRIESLGNFLWTGSDSDLNKLKSLLYEKTKAATEITQLGWNSKGFFVWGNGLFNGKFQLADKYGIVSHGSENFYIPSASKIYEKEDGLYQFERRFINVEGNITLREYVKQFTTVYSENGKIALCFYFASLFRDVVVKEFDKFPLLNLFGPKGAGKNACAEALMYLFGRKQKAPNLHNTSKAALADHVATSSNALCVLDEYRNDLEMEKREFLKGLWDGTGRTRMNMDKDKKKETTSVDQAVIVCGQQMATADIALFSRFVFLSFSQTEYSEQEQLDFKRLDEINKRGLTHLTHHLLMCRTTFVENYPRAVKSTSDLFMELSGNTTVETRIFNNWLMIASAYTAIHELLELPWNYGETMKLMVKLMLEQNAEIQKSDDLGSFWKIIEYLANSMMLFDGGDFKIETKERIIRRWFEAGEWKAEDIIFPQPKNLLYLTKSRVFSLYKEQCRKEGAQPLPDSSIEYYLKNSKAFVCDTKKESFKKIDIKHGIILTDEKGYEKRTSTSAMVFDFDKLGISMGQVVSGEPTLKTEAIHGKLPF